MLKPVCAFPFILSVITNASSSTRSEKLAVLRISINTIYTIIIIIAIIITIIRITVFHQVLFLFKISIFFAYLQLRARRALSLVNDVLLRTRKALLLYKVHDNCALLVLNGTSMNGVITLLVSSYNKKIMFFENAEIKSNDTKIITISLQPPSLFSPYHHQNHQHY